jgi:zinc protease
LAVLAAVVVWAVSGVAWAKDAPARPTTWAHERSDLTPDPSVKFGKLANGMRYALKRNGTPSGAVTIFLKIAAGSLHESDAQKGLAHFLEHMAFAGSTNVPRGEMMKTLQRLGARPGADANAFTSFDETVYMFELPHADAASIDTAFMLLREVADRLTLTQEAMDAERGVVIEELKIADRPPARGARAHFAAMFPGVRHNNRWPIGEQAVIEKAPVSLVRKFYEQYYRPERAVLIVVGEVDPAAIETKIASLFSDWKQPGKSGADPAALGSAPGAGLRAASFADPSLRETVNINWVKPGERTSLTKANYLDAVRRGVALAVVNQRLTVRAREKETPFEAAGAGLGNISGVAEYMRVSALTNPGLWRAALKATDHELRRLTTFGANQLELNREVRRARATSEEATAGAATLSNTFLASVLLSSIRGDFVFLSTDQHVALREEALAGMTAADIDIIARGLLWPEPSALFVTSPRALEGGEAAITQTYREAKQQTVDAPPVVAAVPFPYASFGRAGEVASRRDVAELGATDVRFQNGVRLNIKTTDFKKGDVGVVVRFMGGMLDFPHDQAVLRSAYTDTLVYGGLKGIRFNDLLDTAADRSYGMGVALAEDAFAFSGGTSAKDLLFQMQVFAAYATDAAYEPTALDGAKAEYRDFWRRRRATPRAALSVELGRILRPNDARWTAPTLEVVNALTVENVRTMLDPMLGSRPVDITIVGDVDVEAAVTAVAQTFGALPKRARKYAEPSGARDVRFPAEKQALTLTHEGRVDHALAFVAWPGPDYHTNPRQARAYRLMRDVFASELRDRLRGQGKAYSPDAINFSSRVYPGYGYLAITAETSPTDLDLVYREIDAIAAAMREGNISEDMIVRARTPLVSSLEASQRTNGYWLSALIDYQIESRSLAEQVSIVSDYQSISKAEMVEIARAYLTEARRVEVRVVPAKGAIAWLPRKDLLSSDWVSTFEALGPLTMGTAVPLTVEPILPELSADAICPADQVRCQVGGPWIKPR